MKPLIKQLAIAAFILASVTVLSFGIRLVRFSIYRANNFENSVIAEAGETTTSARSSNPTDQFQSGQLPGANAEPDYYLDGSYTVEIKPDYYPDDSYTGDIEPDPEHANVSDSDKEAPSKAKSSKGDYAKSTGSKGLQRISVGNREDLYLTGEGQVWYVSEQPDGSTAKMQLEEDIVGEINIVDDGKDD